MAKQYFGKAALTVVRQESNGSRVYVYAGQPVGNDVSKAEIRRLEKEGFIEAVDVVVIDEVIDGTEGAAVVDPPTGPSADPQRPAQTASKELWVEFAVAQGYDRGEAEALNKPDLIKALS